MQREGRIYREAEDYREEVKVRDARRGSGAVKEVQKQNTRKGRVK